MPLDKTTVKVGMRVQDDNAHEGTIRWIQKMEKKNKPPHGDTGTYCAVEFDEHWPKSTNRFDGTWEGEKLFDAPIGSCQLLKPTHLHHCMNQRAVTDLRNHYGDRVSHMSDTVLIKFCVARKFDMPKVVEMLNKHLDWEKSYKPTPDIFFPPGMADFYPVGFIDGLDREGNLLYVERPGNGGKYDPSKFVKTFGIETISQWHVASMEEGRRRLRNHPTAKRITMIIDLTKLGDCDMSVVKFGKAIGAIDQDHYPEHLAKMFIVNAPGLFTGVWRIIRAFIDERTKHKISVLGHQFMEPLLKQVEPEYIPDCIGGPNTSWMSLGGRVGTDDPNRVVEAKAAFEASVLSTPKESDIPAESPSSPNAAASPDGDASPNNGSRDNSKIREERAQPIEAVAEPREVQAVG